MSASNFGVRICVLSDGQRIPLLIDHDTGLPAEAPTRFSLAYRWQIGGSSSTAANELRAIGFLLSWARRRSIDLDQRIGSGQFFTNVEIESLADALRSLQRGATSSQSGEKVVFVGLDPAAQKIAKSEPTRRVVAVDTWYQRIKYVQGYLRWSMTDVISRISTQDERFFRIRQRADEVIRKLEESLPPTSEGHREGLPAELRERFLQVIQPDCPENPFQPALRLRNYALLRLYYDTGFRLSEALVLYTTDFDPDRRKPTVTVRRRPHNPLDPRRDLPLVKTNERTVPITPEMANVLETYIVEDRTTRPGAKKTPFIFLARSGKPIAGRTVEDMPKLIRKHFPEFEGHLMTHVLRHDWNDRFSEIADERGWSPEKEMQHRNYLQGWKKTSKQGLHYTRRSAREEASNAALALQKKSWKGADSDG
jgi:integrase